MPTRPKHPCLHPGCPALVEPGSGGRCEAHTLPPRVDSRELSAAARGYDSRWRRFRLAYLREHPLCVDCLQVNRVSAATDVHHRAKLAEHPEKKYDPDNLMALCSTCHKARTARGE